ncbi:Uma2 family endonuclease [Streptomyces sp. NPDC058662]|uniref:Uma2 family endonuclease n=1 Tax=Streptomyces sp. NPDC058662 TaxID=3346583 RepID=UPI00365EDF3F
MTALAHDDATARSDLDEALWLAWQAAAERLPEGFRAEIVEGFIEVSPTGHYSHGRTANRLRRALDAYLHGSGYAAHQDINIVHRRKVWVPDVFIAPEDAEEHVTEDGLGIDASCVRLIVEVVSPGRDSVPRDRVRKRRAYARAGVPVYVLIDDYDDHGTVTVLSAPDPEKAVYDDEVRVPYGTGAVVPEGPARGFVVGEDVTGASRVHRV